MSRKPSFSGNIELLKSINDVAKNQFAIKEGNNIEFDYDVNNQTTTINVINTPKFDDVVLVKNISLLNELNAKYSIKNDVVIEDNKISLNLGSIDGLQVPTKQTEAVNKKYVDESLDYFWEQILKMNFVNFKGVFNDKLTYHTGDLVVFLDLVNNDYYFYLSLIDLNNEPLNNKDAWIKISTPIPNNLITEDVLNLEVQKLEQKITDGDNDLNNKIINQDALITDLTTRVEVLEKKKCETKKLKGVITKQITGIELMFYDDKNNIVEFDNNQRLSTWQNDKNVITNKTSIYNNRKKCFEIYLSSVAVNVFFITNYWFNSKFSNLVDLDGDEYDVKGLIKLSNNDIMEFYIYKIN